MWEVMQIARIRAIRARAHGSYSFLEVEPHTNLDVPRVIGLAEDSSEVLQIKERRIWILETNAIHYVDGIDPDLQTGALTKPQLGSLG